MPIFPVPVSSADIEFNQSDSKKRTTEQISAHYLLEKIGRVLDSCMYCIVCTSISFACGFKYQVAPLSYEPE